MIINNALVHMQVQHELVSERRESLNVQFIGNPQTSENPPTIPVPPDISQAANASEAAQETQQIESLRKNIELEVSLLKQLVERLTGKRIEFFTPDNAAEMTASAELDNSNGAIDANAQWGLIMNSSSSIRESEKLSFEASAIVHTRDGKAIEVNLAFHYSREINIEQQFTLRAGQALKDPLVLNFSGSSLELATDTYEFDLDVDGSIDRIPLFQSNTAFLALDNNRDGIINDGSELFGAISGDGFSDLRQFDSDKNHWIDENDDVFSQLQLFRPGPDGRSQLISLNEAGVGALYLGNISTPFQLRSNASQELAGELRSSGLYLMESGIAGSMHQLDLAV